MPELPVAIDPVLLRGVAARGVGALKVLANVVERRRAARRLQAA